MDPEAATLAAQKLADQFAAGSAPAEAPVGIENGDAHSNKRKFEDGPEGDEEQRKKSNFSGPNVNQVISCSISCALHNKFQGRSLRTQISLRRNHVRMPPIIEDMPGSTSRSSTDKLPINWQARSEENTGEKRCLSHNL
jgi:hypothetical protein